MKQFLNSEENNSLIKYYCALRLNPLFNIVELPVHTSYAKSKFYNEIIVLIRKIVSIKNFPNATTSDIYTFLLPSCQPAVNSQIHINWTKTWKNLNFKYIKINERDIMFKFLHNIITTKSRLFQIKKIDSPVCLICNLIEDKTHMFIECKKIKYVLPYFRNMLNKICKIENIEINNILHLNFKVHKKNKKIQQSC